MTDTPGVSRGADKDAQWLSDRATKRGLLARIVGLKLKVTAGPLTLVRAKSWVFGLDYIHLRVLPAAAPRGSAQLDSCRTDYELITIPSSPKIVRWRTREHG